MNYILRNYTVQPKVARPVQLPKNDWYIRNTLRFTGTTYTDDNIRAEGNCKDREFETYFICDGRQQCVIPAEKLLNPAAKTSTHYENVVPVRTNNAGDADLSCPTNSCRGKMFKSFAYGSEGKCRISPVRTAVILPLAKQIVRILSTKKVRRSSLTRQSVMDVTDIHASADFCHSQTW